MMDRAATDVAFLRYFCLGREDDEAVAAAVSNIALKNPGAYDAALALGPWVDVDPDEVFVSIAGTAAPAPSWVH